MTYMIGMTQGNKLSVEESIEKIGSMFAAVGSPKHPIFTVVKSEVGRICVHVVPDVKQMPGYRRTDITMPVVVRRIKGMSYNDIRALDKAVSEHVETADWYLCILKTAQVTDNMFRMCAAYGVMWTVVRSMILDEEGVMHLLAGGMAAAYLEHPISDHPWLGVPSMADTLATYLDSQIYGTGVGTGLMKGYSTLASIKISMKAARATVKEFVDDFEGRCELLKEYTSNIPVGVAKWARPIIVHILNKMQFSEAAGRLQYPVEVMEEHSVPPTTYRYLAALYFTGKEGNPYHYDPDRKGREKKSEEKEDQ